MRISRTLVLTLFALFFIVSGVGAQDMIAYADGSYFLRYVDPELGKVAISVTVKQGKLAEVKLPEGPGDVDLDDAALASYLAALVAAPDYMGVDAISGASQSCDLIKYAVQNALKAAVKK